MSEKGTFGQAQQVLNLIIQKGLTTEQIHALYCSGLLSDLLEADVKNVNREEFQKVIGIYSDYFIQPDRSVKPKYPNWVAQLIYPELESAGPKKIDLRKLKYFRHPEQGRKETMGTTVHQFLKENKLLKSCLNFQDGLAIMKKGINLFNKMFTIQSVYLWSSVVIADHGNHFVPYLMPSANKVILDWKLIDANWGINDIALIRK